MLCANWLHSSVSLHRPVGGVPTIGGGTQDIDFDKGFTKGIFTKIFGEDFGGVRGHCDPLIFLRDGWAADGGGERILMSYKPPPLIRKCLIRNESLDLSPVFVS